MWYGNQRICPFHFEDAYPAYPSTALTTGTAVVGTAAAVDSEEITSGWTVGTVVASTLMAGSTGVSVLGMPCATPVLYCPSFSIE